MNLDKIETSAPLRFRAVPTLEEPLIFELDDLSVDIDTGHSMIGSSGIKLKDCAIDQFTGHCDATGKEIYGGDILTSDTKTPYGFPYWLIGFYEMRGQWCIFNLRGNLVIALARRPREHATIIGNIHNVDGLPEEVRRLLAHEIRRFIIDEICSAHKEENSHDTA